MQQASVPMAPKRSTRGYVVNQRLLWISLALVLVLGGLGYLWYQFQVKRMAQTFLVRAENLESRKDWTKAVGYYLLYLNLRPDDVDAITRLVKVLDQQEPTPERVRNVNSRLNRALGLAPDRHQLRLELANNLLKLGDFVGAEDAARKLADKGPEFEKAARRVMAIAQYSVLDNSNQLALNESLKNLVASARELPGDVDLIRLTAAALRSHASLSVVDGMTSAALADRLINDLVAADPKNTEALVTRHLYRQSFGLPAPAADLQAALEIDPENVDALYFAAVAVLSELPPGPVAADAPQLPAIKLAEERLQKLVGRSPGSSRPYLALGLLLDKTGRVDDAIKVLKEGAANAIEPLEIQMSLVAVQLNAGKIEEAVKAFQEVEVRSATYLSQLSITEKSQLENRIRLLESRLNVLQGKNELATNKLRTIVLSEETLAPTQRSPEWLQAARMLGSQHSAQGEFDQAGDYWDRLCEAKPDNAEYCRLAAEMQIRSGSVAAAVERMDAFAQRQALSPDLVVLRVQALLILESERGKTERNWAEFEQALRQAQTLAPDRWELTVAEVDWNLAEGKNLEQVLGMLRNAESKHASDELFWQNLAQRYRQLKAEPDLNRAVAKYKEVSKSAASGALLEAAMLFSAGKLDDAKRALSQGAEKMQGDDRLMLQLRIAEMQAASGKLADALESIKKLITANPQHLACLRIGVELALAGGELNTAETWENTLRSLTNDAAEVKLLRIRRLMLSLDELDSAQREQLKRWIVELRTERPKWFPIIALAAQYEEFVNNKRQALLDYQLAVSLGDRRPYTIGRYVEILYEFGQFPEAQAALSLLATDRVNRSVADAMRAELEAKQNGPEVAIRLSRESVQRFPMDAKTHLYLASLLLRYGRADEAMQVLVTASKRLPGDYRIWMSLISAYVQFGREDDAEKTVAGLLENKSIPADRIHWVLAQGYELLRNYQEASTHYQKAIEARPSDLNIRQGYAKMLTRVSVRGAREQFEQILQIDPLNQTARLELAVLLASTGEESDWARSAEFLDAVSASQGLNKDRLRQGDRIRALLLSRKGRTMSERIANSQTARAALVRLIETQSAEIAEQCRPLLAQILEQEFALSRDESLLKQAHEQLILLVQARPQSVEDISRLIEFDLRHGAPLASSGPAAVNMVSAELKTLLLEDAEKQLKNMNAMPGQADRGVQSLSVALNGRVLQALGRPTEAKLKVEQFINEMLPGENNKPSAQLMLMAGKLYSSIEAHVEAEQWYRRLMQNTPNAYVLVVQSLISQGKRREAAFVCLQVAADKPNREVATVLANVLTTADGKFEVIAAADRYLKAARAAFPEDIELLQAVAVMHASRGEYDDAIADFRQIVQLKPNDELALNNLATLLSEQPNQLSEALGLIERAMGLAGRQAQLLDTQGTIYLKQGDALKSVSSLEEAVASGIVDARVYLHLAAAYQLAQRPADAALALDQARKLRIDQFVLTAGDRELLEKLEQGLQKSSGVSVESGSTEGATGA